MTKLLRKCSKGGELVSSAPLLIVLVLAFVVSAGFFACQRDEKLSSVEEDEAYDDLISRLRARYPYPPSAITILALPFSIPSTMHASDAIVRAKLIDRLPAAVDDETGQADLFSAAVDYVFETVEYLKGSGPDRIRVRVPDALPRYYGTEDEMREYIAHRLRKSSLDSVLFHDREAVLFLAKYMTYQEVKDNIAAGRPQRDRSHLVGTRDPSLFSFSHGHLRGFMPTNLEISITSSNIKVWLPAAGGEGEDTKFFTDHEPDDPRNNGSDFGGDEAPTVTLRELREQIASLAADVELGDGSAEYVSCVVTQHAHQNGYKRNGFIPEIEVGYRTNSLVMDSGLPADTVLHTERHYGDDKSWTTGDSADHFGIRVSEPHERHHYPKDVYTTRPLPAGEYRFFYNTQSWLWFACDYYPDSVHETYEWTVAVEAPEGTLHEAFFDPGIDGDSVGFMNGEFGTMTPADIADSAISIDRLSWSGDQVKLSGSGIDGLSETVADFIDLHGETVLTISLGGLQGDEECDAESSSLVWNVAEQPWGTDDRLMIRIRDSSTETTALPVISCG